MIDIIHFENVAGSAIDFAGSIFPVIHEILRSKQMPTVLKVFTVIFSPAMQIKSLNSLLHNKG